MTADVHVVGTGLIGTSIGMALHGRLDVVLSDAQPDRVARAVSRGAGRSWDGREVAELVVVATPSGTIARVVQQMQVAGLGSHWTHVASVQSAVQSEVEQVVGRPAAVCGGHPMAGRERSGPDAASASLFRDRPWLVCPAAVTDPSAVAAVDRLATLCGAEPVRLSPRDHDAAVALVSHLPQVAASAVAAQLTGSAADAVRLAGPGLQDTTRIAASDPAMWTALLASNAARVAPLVRRLSAELADVADALEATADPALAEDARQAVAELLRRGNDGRALVPVKRGAHDDAFSTVTVSVPDRPGQLAGLLVSAAEAGVNVEDVRVEHLPGSPHGLIELLVAAGTAAVARDALAAAGWAVAAAD